MLFEHKCVLAVCVQCVCYVTATFCVHASDVCAQKTEMALKRLVSAIDILIKAKQMFLTEYLSYEM